MREYDDLDAAESAADAGEISVGMPVSIGGARYVLSSIMPGGATFRPVVVYASNLVGESPLPNAPPPTPRARTLPDDDAERKTIPLFAGCLLYFPAALVEVARCSKRGNDQHNPGQPLHWARGKSMAQMESQLHHMLDQAESTGAERIEHLAANAWRALAELQLECERQGAPLAPSAKEPDHDD